MAISGDRRPQALPELSPSFPNGEFAKQPNNSSENDHNDSSSSTEDPVVTHEVSVLLPNPWIDNPNPKSKSNPGIVCRLKSFPNLVRVMHETSMDWPYRLYPPRHDRILFYEFRGFGRPSDDFGWPGDFYLDLTPFPRYFLYVRHAKYWYCNNWDPDPTRLEFPLHRHPLLSNRYLWATKGWGFMWLTGQTIRTEGRSSIRRERDHEPMILKALRYDDKEPLPVEFNDDTASRELAEKELRADAFALWLEEQEDEEIAAARRLTKEKRRLKMEHYDLEYQKKHEGREENPQPTSSQQQPKIDSISSDDSVIDTGRATTRNLPTQFNQEDMSNIPVPARWRRPLNSPGADENCLDMEQRRVCGESSSGTSGPFSPAASAVSAPSPPPSTSILSENEPRTQVPAQQPSVRGGQRKETAHNAILGRLASDLFDNAISTVSGIMPVRILGRQHGSSIPTLPSTSAQRRATQPPRPPPSIPPGAQKYSGLALQQYSKPTLSRVSKNFIPFPPRQPDPPMHPITTDLSRFTHGRNTLPTKSINSAQQRQQKERGLDMVQCGIKQKTAYTKQSKFRILHHTPTNIPPRVGLNGGRPDSGSASNPGTSAPFPNTPLPISTAIHAKGTNQQSTVVQTPSEGRERRGEPNLSQRSLGPPTPRATPPTPKPPTSAPPNDNQSPQNTECTLETPNNVTPQTPTTIQQENGKHHTIECLPDSKIVTPSPSHSYHELQSRSPNDEGGQEGSGQFNTTALAVVEIQETTIDLPGQRGRTRGISSSPVALCSLRDVASVIDGMFSRKSLEIISQEEEEPEGDEGDEEENEEGEHEECLAIVQEIQEQQESSSEGSGDDSEGSTQENYGVDDYYCHFSPSPLEAVALVPTGNDTNDAVQDMVGALAHHHQEDGLSNPPLVRDSEDIVMSDPCPVEGQFMTSPLLSPLFSEMDEPFDFSTHDKTDKDSLVTPLRQTASLVTENRSSLERKRQSYFIDSGHNSDPDESITRNRSLSAGEPVSVPQSGSPTLQEHDDEDHVSGHDNVTGEEEVDMVPPLIKKEYLENSGNEQSEKSSGSEFEDAEEDGNDAMDLGEQLKVENENINETMDFDEPITEVSGKSSAGSHPTDSAVEHGEGQLSLPITRSQMNHTSPDTKSRSRTRPDGPHPRTFNNSFEAKIESTTPCLEHLSSTLIQNPPGREIEHLYSEKRNEEVQGEKDSKGTNIQYSSNPLESRPLSPSPLFTDHQTHSSEDPAREHSDYDQESLSLEEDNTYSVEARDTPGEAKGAAVAIATTIEEPGTEQAGNGMIFEIDHVLPHTGIPLDLRPRRYKTPEFVFRRKWTTSSIYSDDIILHSEPRSPGLSPSPSSWDKASLEDQTEPEDEAHHSDHTNVPPIGMMSKEEEGDLIVEMNSYARLPSGEADIITNVPEIYSGTGLNLSVEGGTEEEGITVGAYDPDESVGGASDRSYQSLYVTESNQAQEDGSGEEEGHDADNRRDDQVKKPQITTETPEPNYDVDDILADGEQQVTVSHTPPIRSPPDGLLMGTVCSIQPETPGHEALSREGSNVPLSPVISPASPMVVDAHMEESDVAIRSATDLLHFLSAGRLGLRGGRGALGGRLAGVNIKFQEERNNRLATEQRVTALILEGEQKDQEILELENALNRTLHSLAEEKDRQTQLSESVQNLTAQREQAHAAHVATELKLIRAKQTLKPIQQSLELV